MEIFDVFAKKEIKLEDAIERDEFLQFNSADFERFSQIPEVIYGVLDPTTYITGNNEEIVSINDENLRLTLGYLTKTSQYIKINTKHKNHERKRSLFQNHVKIVIESASSLEEKQKPVIIFYESDYTKHIDLINSYLEQVKNGTSLCLALPQLIKAKV